MPTWDFKGHAEVNLNDRNVLHTHRILVPLQAERMPS